MARYKIITLVDITRSNAHRSEIDKLKVGQQANFNSLVQTIGLRSNLDWNKDPVMHDGILPDPLEGKANHWIWEFNTERDFVFKKDDDLTGLLKDDLYGVPVVAQLNNSVDIDPACFITQGKNQNTWIYEITN
jgi:hypothetical protein